MRVCFVALQYLSQVVGDAQTPSQALGCVVMQLAYCVSVVLITLAPSGLRRGKVVAGFITCVVGPLGMLVSLVQLHYVIAGVELLSLLMQSNTLLSCALRQPMVLCLSHKPGGLSLL